jgi:hypothetical protein
MRHFFVARPVTTLSRGMAASPRRIILVALSVGRSLRRNKSGRGRSSCRSAPASDSPRKGTAALIPHRYGRNRDRHMDDRRDCRDTAPACVPSTCGARRRCGTAKFDIGAGPAPRKQQTTTRHPGGAQPDADQQNSNISSASAARLRLLCPPEPTLASDPVGSRGFIIRPPSTPGGRCGRSPAT